MKKHFFSTALIFLVLKSEFFEEVFCGKSAVQNSECDFRNHFTSLYTWGHSDLIKHVLMTWASMTMRSVFT